jgi:hypothetical protein
MLTTVSFHAKPHPPRQQPDPLSLHLSVDMEQCGGQTGIRAFDGSMSRFAEVTAIVDVFHHLMHYELSVFPKVPIWIKSKQKVS